MKKVIVILVGLLLSGCYQLANIADIKKAEYFCQDKEGVLEIVIFFMGSEIVTCQNGERVDAGTIELPKETLTDE